jgi:filamentous hemagglutinin
MARSAVNPLPHYEKAVIEDDKLVSYALDPQSERGQHKARVFESALGFNLSNWAQLRQVILETLPYHNARLTTETTFGKKYEVVLPITGANGRTVDVVTIWQFDRLPDTMLFIDVPRLVTLYIP